MDEDERAGLLRRRPEVAQARVAEVGAARHGRDLDAAQPPVAHQLDELLGPLGVDGAEHDHAVARERGERLVLALDLDAAEVDPRRQHDDVDAGSILLLEDPRQVGELAQRGADLAPAEADDLAPLVPRDLGPEAGDDHVRVRVDDRRAHAGWVRPTGAVITSRGSCPRSSSSTIAALRPGAPVIEPPGCVVAPVW